MIMSVLRNWLWESGHSVTLNHNHLPMVGYLISQQYCMVHPIGGWLSLQFIIYFLVWYDWCSSFVAILFKVPHSSFLLLPSNYNRAELTLLSDWCDHTIQVLAYCIYIYLYMKPRYKNSSSCSKTTFTLHCPLTYHRQQKMIVSIGP